MYNGSSPVSSVRLEAIIAPLEDVLKARGFTPTRKSAISGLEMRGYFRNGNIHGKSVAVSYWLLVLADNGSVAGDVHSPNSLNCAELQVRVYIYGTRKQLPGGFDCSYTESEPIEKAVGNVLPGLLSRHLKR